MDILSANKKKFMLFLLVFSANAILCGNISAQSSKQPATLKTDTVKSPFHKIFSLHTNLIDFALTVPNVGVEIDFDRRQRSHNSIIISGRYNWNTFHTIQPKNVFNVSGVKGEFRKYWRTGNRENANIPPVERIERDTTISAIPRELSYLRRRYVSSYYVKNPRDWRAYYWGVYAAYNRYSISFGGTGRQGTAASLGLSYGWTLPVTKRVDGSGFDLDLGISAGVTATKYDKYSYVDESACYSYASTRDWHFLPYPMIQDVHVSLVYRFRSVDKKVLYGAERFAYNETLRQERENERYRKMENRRTTRDSLALVRPLDEVVLKAEAQLAKYNKESYSYYVLSNAIEQAKHDRETLYGSSMLRNVLIKELEYYMKIAEEREDRKEGEDEKK